MQLLMLFGEIRRFTLPIEKVEYVMRSIQPVSITQLYLLQGNKKFGLREVPFLHPYIHTYSIYCARKWVRGSVVGRMLVHSVRVKRGSSRRRHRLPFVPFKYRWLSLLYVLFCLLTSTAPPSVSQLHLCSSSGLNFAACFLQEFSETAALC